MDKSKYTYTFIIPHKNTPELLIRCINSIPNRNDIQIIIVDDNSDIPVDINSISHKKNIELYLTKEGKGAGFARNIGLEKAKGKWVLFSDADDFYPPNIIEILDKNINRYFNCDILYFMVNSCNSKTLEPANRHLPINQYIKASHKDPENVKFKIFDTWNKVFNYNFLRVNNLHFEEVISGNDILFSTKADYYAKETAICEDILYIVTVSPSSLSYTLSKNIIHSRITERAKRTLFLNQKNRKNKTTSCFGLLKKAYKISPFYFIKEMLYYYKLVSYSQLIYDIITVFKKKYNDKV